MPVTSLECRQRMGELHNKATAIAERAKYAQRDLTAAEHAEFDEHMRQYNQIKDHDLARAQWVEGVQEQRLSGSSPVVEPYGTFRGSDGASLNNYPNAPRPRVGTLRAYHSPADAYLSGRFLAATLFRHDGSAKWCRDRGIDTTFHGALKESANELGGFLVPSLMEETIINLRETYGVARRESRITPMTGDTKMVPRRTGGVTGYFVGENTEISDSDAAWDTVKLIAKKYAVLVKYSSEISEDTFVTVGDELTDEIAQAFSLIEDQCLFIGDGSSTYGGMVGVVNALAAGSIVTAASTHVSFETLTTSDFASCVGKLPTFAENGAKWFMSKAGYYASVGRLKDAAGGNRNVDLERGDVPLWLGFPVIITQVMNSTLGSDASQPKAIFGNMRQGSTLGNRRGMGIVVSDQRYFEQDQLAIKGTMRFDVNVHENGTATTPGSLILLKTAAS